MRPCGPCHNLARLLTVTSLHCEKEFLVLLEDHDQHVRRLAFEALKWASADGKDAALSASILLLDKVLMIGDL